MKKEILPQQIWNEEKMEGIKKLIQKQKLIEIIKSDEDAKIFVEALENIPEPNDKLKKAFRDFGKQETLEEAASKWVFETNGHKWSNNNDEAGDNFGSFIAGFKEAERRLHSEEEVLVILEWLKDIPRSQFNKEFVQKFKKK